MEALAHLFGLVSAQYLPDFHTWWLLRWKVLCFDADGDMARRNFTGRYSVTAKSTFYFSTSTESGIRVWWAVSEGVAPDEYLRAIASWWSLSLRFVWRTQIFYLFFMCAGLFRLTRGSSSVGENSVSIEAFCIRASAVRTDCKPNDWLAKRVKLAFCIHV